MSFYPKMSGSGWDTNPQHVLWFCHICHWSGTLPAQTPHVCKPPLSDAAAPKP